MDRLLSEQEDRRSYDISFGGFGRKKLRRRPSHGKGDPGGQVGEMTHAASALQLKDREGVILRLGALVGARDGTVSGPMIVQWRPTQAVKAGQLFPAVV